MNIEKVLGAVAGAVAGLLVGWAGQSLTLAGRVTAIEATLIRIENRLYAAPAPVAKALP